MGFRDLSKMSQISMSPHKRFLLILAKKIRKYPTPELVLGSQEGKIAIQCMFYLIVCGYVSVRMGEVHV